MGGASLGVILSIGTVCSGAPNSGFKYSFSGGQSLGFLDEFLSLGVRMESQKTTSVTPELSSMWFYNFIL